MKRQTVIEHIERAFGANSHPGDAYLQGSFEGCEPFDEVSAFRAKNDWRALDAEWLDAHGAALSFFSEAGLRFFLPAFLIADLAGLLRCADPLFHLTGAFHETSIEVPTPAGVRVRAAGGSVLLNPVRYGAMTFADYARCRLSVFAREEAAAIVDYLEYRRDADREGRCRAQIEAALASFWHARRAQAPPREALERHVREQDAFLAAIDGDTRRR